MTIIIILILILLNGVFAMAEIALISARKTRLEVQANKGDVRAKEALRLANHPDTFLSTVQIGITLMTILTGIFSEDTVKQSLIEYINTFPAFLHYSESMATVIVVFCITYLSLVSELVGKKVGLSMPESIAKSVAAPMRFLSIVTHPFIWLLSKSTKLISKIFKIKTNDSSVTEEEIKAMISEGTETGAIEETEQEIIQRVFHLGDRNITSLMTHRSDLVWMDVKNKVVDIKQKMREVVHTSYPVCEGQIDNIKGIVSIKDILLADDETPLTEMMTPGLYVPENNTVYQVLEKFKKHNSSTCFIVDEYGSLEGMMTLNDILEAIVGDIAPGDEDDWEILKREDGTYLVDAQMPFYDYLSRFQRTEYISDEELEFNTVAGFLLHLLGSIPQTGDKVHWKDFDFEIIDMDGNRIDKILVTISDVLRSEMEDDE